MGKEIWKSIPNTRNNYLISSLGRVKSPDRTIKFIVNGKRRISTLKEHFIIPRRKGLGKGAHEYLTVTIGKRSTGTPNELSVHRLVAQAFIPNPQNKPEVNHKKGDKTDNRASQLEWVTSSENKQHAKRTGLLKRKK